MRSHISDTPLQRLSISDQIAQSLRASISSGKLECGALLKQDDIAARFNVSKIPVREALKRLEAEGLVEFLPNRGAVVATLSIDEVQEYFEIRATLEAMAAEIAAPRMTDEIIDRAEQLFDEFGDELDVARWGEMNWMMHATLYSAANRPILMETIVSIHHKTERYVRALLALTPEMPNTQREHGEIIAAFRRRDGIAAAQLTRAHVLEAGKSLVQHLKQQRLKGVEG